ncbi:MAG: thiosulfate oxidation carrier complex protein SoxZ [Mesorhizobium sp.]|nr:thiosulfate oxidation carrier complex protein SoxZ [Mesorhizobium sp.]
MSRPRVSIPDTAAAGELITIRALISHVMENGLRRDSSGEIIPRRIINRFTCAFNGETVFACDLDSAIAANPYFEFTAKVPESGTFQFEWHDDDGSVYTDEHAITVG